MTEKRARRCTWTRAHPPTSRGRRRASCLQPSFVRGGGEASGVSLSVIAESLRAACVRNPRTRDPGRAILSLSLSRERCARRSLASLARTRSIRERIRARAVNPGSRSRFGAYTRVCSSSPPPPNTMARSHAFNRDRDHIVDSANRVGACARVVRPIDSR